jgi:hypothetical protein
MVKQFEASGGISRVMPGSKDYVPPNSEGERVAKLFRVPRITPKILCVGWSK